MVKIPEIALNSGRKIPVIGLGLMLFLTPELDSAEVTYQGLKQGYRLLDTAQAYGNEESVCKGITRWIDENPEYNKREDVIYTTKIFDPDHGYENTKRAVKVSLERAKSIGYIDIVMMHSPQSDDERRHGSWIALQEFVAAGKVKQLGVSNYGVKHLEQLLAYKDLKVKPCINQIQLHPWLLRISIVDYCKENGIVVQAYPPMPKQSRIDDPDVTEMAEWYDKSMSQILLRWSIQSSFVPIPRVFSMKSIVSNIDVFDFELSEEDMDTLSLKKPFIDLVWDATLYPIDNEKELGRTYDAGSWEKISRVKKGALLHMKTLKSKVSLSKTVETNAYSLKNSAKTMLKNSAKKSAKTPINGVTGSKALVAGKRSTKSIGSKGSVEPEGSKVTHPTMTVSMSQIR